MIGCIILFWIYKIYKISNQILNIFIINLLVLVFRNYIDLFIIISIIINFYLFILNISYLSSYNNKDYIIV